MANCLASLTLVYRYTIAIGDPGVILCVTTKEAGQGRGKGCRENFVNTVNCVRIKTHLTGGVLATHSDTRPLSWHLGG